MPVKKLTDNQYDRVLDSLDDMDPDDSDYGYVDTIEQLNHIFAKIYAYKRAGRAKSRAPGTKPKAKKPRSKKQTANDKRIGRLMKQGFSMKEAHRINRGGY